jgi:hypothetical protein
MFAGLFAVCVLNVKVCVLVGDFTCFCILLGDFTFAGFFAANFAFAGFFAADFTIFVFEVTIFALLAFDVVKVHASVAWVARTIEETGSITDVGVL